MPKSGYSNTTGSVRLRRDSTPDLVWSARRDAIRALESRLNPDSDTLDETGLPVDPRSLRALILKLEDAHRKLLSFQIERPLPTDDWKRHFRMSRDWCETTA